jgi:hypothetical protein
VVANGHWLATLQVCVSWNDCFGVTACLFEKRILKSTKKSKEVINSVPTIEASVGGNLIISRPGRVQLGADRADQLNQPRLDSHVDVFVLGPWDEGTAGELFAHLVQAREDRVSLLGIQNFGGVEHGDVGAAALEVFSPHAEIDIKAGTECDHVSGRAFGEAAVPESHQLPRSRRTWPQVL